jgi:hypothetical protein
MGAHPFRIQSAVNGSTGTQYNDGITNNDVSNGTLTWDVQFDAPNLLYYQCTAHGSMGGKIYILNSEDNVSAGTTSAPSISPSGDSNTGIFFPSADTIAFAEGGAEAMRIDSSSRLLVGTSTNIGSQNIQIGTAHGTLGLYKFANNDDGGELTLANSRNGTVGSQTIVNNNDFLGRIFFRGSDGSAFLRGADIVCQVDGTPGTNDMPGRIVLSTTAVGASSPTERMRITSAGKLTVPGVYNGTTTGGSAVYVEADGDLLRFTSSRKYKTDIETIEDEKADAILECRPVWYRSLSQNDIKTEGATKSDWGWYGFIAEEVAEIDPRLVSWATKDAVPQEDGSLKSIERDPVDYEAEGVRYDNFVPLLLNLIKRQKEQIEAMEARLTALETPVVPFTNTPS